MNITVKDAIVGSQGSRFHAHDCWMPGQNVSGLAFRCFFAIQGTVKQISKVATCQAAR